MILASPGSLGRPLVASLRALGPCEDRLGRLGAIIGRLEDLFGRVGALLDSSGRPAAGAGEGPGTEGGLSV